MRFRLPPVLARLAGRIRPGTEEQVLRFWQWILRAVVVVTAAGMAYRSRLCMNPDGVSYLDLGDAVAAGDLDTAVNRYWNPLYPLVLLAFRALAGFSARYEFQVVHLATFFLFLLCLLGYEFLLRQMLAPELAGRRAPTDPAPGAADEPCPPRAMLVLLGYPFLLWVAVFVIDIPLVTPDMLVAALALFAGGLVVRFRSGRVGWRGGLALGLVLGLAYLTKTAMLFVGVAFLGAAWLAAGLRRGLRTAAVAAAVYLLVAGGWAAALSVDAGRVTFGDSGRLNFAWMVNNVRYFAHAEANQGRNGTLVHPPRIVLRHPRVYEYAEPIGGTFPLWFDPVYWHEGLRPAYDRTRHELALERSWGRYVDMSQDYGLQIRFFLVAVLTVLLAAGRSRARMLWDGLRRGQLVLAALAPFVMYALIAVRARYLGPFALLFGLGLLHCLRVRRDRLAWLVAPALALSLVLGYTVVADSLRDEESRCDDSQWRMAEALRERGFEPGTRLGYVGYTFGTYFARLGRYRIVADSPREHARAFWEGDAALRQRVVEAFRQTPAEALVVGGTASPGEGFERLGATDAWLYRLRSPTEGSPAAPGSEGP